MPAWTKELLPKPTRDLERARADIDQWGYCLLQDALEEPLLSRCRKRLEEQAAAEKQRGLAFEDGGPAQKWGAFRDENGEIRSDAFTAAHGGVNQRVWMLVNKGACFIEALERDAVLDTVGHVLGEEFLVSSLTANIAKPGGIPMDLHTDQWWAPEPTRPGRRGLPVGSMTRTTFDYDAELTDPPPMLAPAACSNVLFMLNGMTETNGGTRVVPGSHRFGRHPDKERDKDMSWVAAEGPPGCAIITDGRLWHGTGANVGNTERLAMILTFCGPQYRPQENYTVGIRQDVYERLSDRTKAMLGFKVWWAYGRTGDPTVDFINPGETSVGELRPQ
ncbi:MAG: phytanoyl-CoA dioxygenase family protein [Hyphomicrobiaceae bacterium]